jgi:hypothetical protein
MSAGQPRGVLSVNLSNGDLVPGKMGHVTFCGLAELHVRPSAFRYVPGREELVSEQSGAVGHCLSQACT